jgi:hypothetical protein
MVMLGLSKSVALFAYVKNEVIGLFLRGQKSLNNDLILLLI